MIEGALSRAGLKASDLAVIGLTNQRETTVIWDRRTGEPVHNAIVWQDTRTSDLCNELAGDEGTDRFRAKTGLPLATHFSGPKARHLLHHLDLKERAERGELPSGQSDSWIAWNLTGGPREGVTSPTSPMPRVPFSWTSRRRQWDADLSLEIGVPSAILPEIVPSIGLDLECAGPLSGVRLAAILGDQQAALVGQAVSTRARRRTPTAPGISSC